METTSMLPENIYTLARQIAINVLISSCDRLGPPGKAESTAFLDT